MATILIRNASLFSPDPLGTNDILIINDRIAAIAQNVSVPEWLGPVQEMDGKGLFAVPGFIDAHVHITGGGGEAGFSSQVPPLPLSKLIRSGVTTVGGLLGTDGVTRHVDAVLAKANSLEEEGVSSFIMSGGYPVPSPTLTGSIRSDIAFIEKVRGGKIAIADHRVAPLYAETQLAVGVGAGKGRFMHGSPHRRDAPRIHRHVDHAYRRGGGRAFLCIRRAGTRAALGAPPDRHAHQP